MTPPIQHTLPFNSHYECTSAGYLNGLEMVQKMGQREVEKNRLFVAFNCIPEEVI
jgi:hypothetical protein|tara:strand:- start:99 stop:263 length:165 start_codon:yes stop_codon:yes gene_type:complete